jgi:hypothetical protein
VERGARRLGLRSPARLEWWLAPVPYHDKLDVNSAIQTLNVAIGNDVHQAYLYKNNATLTSGLSKNMGDCYGLNPRLHAKLTELMDCSEFQFALLARDIIGESILSGRLKAR